MQRRAEVDKMKIPAVGEVVTECVATATVAEESKLCGTALGSPVFFLGERFFINVNLDFTCVMGYDK